MRFNSTNTLVLSCVLPFVFCVNNTAAQTEPNKAISKATVTQKSRDSARATSVEATPQIVKKPFAPISFSTSLPITAYLENDPEKVFSWVQGQIAALPRKIDQFSTSEERQQFEIAISERMKSIGQLAFISPCQKKYDPDQQEFNVKVILLSVKDSTLKTPNPEALNLRQMTLAISNLKMDTYTGQNAYGASTEISRTVSDNYVLTFPAGASYEPTSILMPSRKSSTRLPYQYTSNFLNFIVKMPSSQAREQEKQMACMSVFSLESPYFFKFKERTIPSRDMPFDATTTGYALFGRLDQIAVVNKFTGEIYDQAARSKD
ncbi:hypothetical protein [Polaromonas sp. DSR2-3-2]|uniref:hypothetical protein n=1 Tax=unclassified Polaromonas TaxID=2638319 RepID=UPI003CF00AAC